MLAEDQVVPYQVSTLPVAEGPWMVFAPHADDESLGMGGTLLKAAQAGIAVHLVVMTDGALGGRRQGLAAIRRAEARAAARQLGIREVHFLEQPDRRLARGEKLVSEVADRIRAATARAAFFPGPFELHPDHRVTAAVVWEALKNLPAPNAPESVTRSVYRARSIAWSI